MTKYNDISSHIVELLGGKDNIVFFTHCVTRLRFNLKDKSLVQQKKIEQLDKVVGTQWSGEQFQIIIGQDVETAYNQIIEKNHLKPSIDNGSNNTQEKKKSKGKFSFSSFLDILSGCIVPVIPILMGTGMIKVLLLLLTTLNVMSTKDSTYFVLNFISDAGFYFLPIFVGSTSAKKFGTSEPIGMLLGAVLISPAFIQSVAKGDAISLFNIPIFKANYTFSLFPTILAVFVMSYIERYLKRFVPNVLKSILVPFLTIMIAAPLTLWIIGPIGYFIGNWLMKGILWLYSMTGFLGIGIFAAIYPLMVMTGMHTVLNPYSVQAFATLGYEPITTIGMFVSNFAQGATCLAVGVKAKNNKVLRSNAFSCAFTMFAGGITEPALFGISAKYKTPLYGSMIGSFAGGLFGGLMQVRAYAMAGNGGPIGLACLIGPNAMNLVWGIASVFVSMIVTFIAIYILFKVPENDASKSVTIKNNALFNS